MKPLWWMAPPWGWGRSPVVPGPEPGTFTVASQTTSSVFYVVNQAAQTCTCLDHQVRHRVCKHLALVGQHLGAQDQAATGGPGAGGSGPGPGPGGGIPSG